MTLLLTTSVLTLGISTTGVIVGMALSDLAPHIKYSYSFGEYHSGAKMAGCILTPVSALFMMISFPITILYMSMVPPLQLRVDENNTIIDNITHKSTESLAAHKTNLSNATAQHSFERCFTEYVQDNCFIFRDRAKADCWLWHDQESHGLGVQLCSQIAKEVTGNIAKTTN